MAPTSQIVTSPPSLLPRLPRGRGLLLLGVLVAGVLAAAAYLVLGRDEPQRGVLNGPSSDPFSIRYPSSWRALSSDELELVPGKPLGALQRKDKTSLVVVRRVRGQAGGDLNKFSRKLADALQKQFKDFKGSSAKLVRTKRGKAFYMSYVRTKRGTVHGLVIVPAGKRTYTIDTGTRAGHTASAREIGRMIRSFDVR